MTAEAEEREPRSGVTAGWDCVIDDCIARFHAAASPEEKSHLLLRIGRVFRVELGDAEQAFDAALEAFRLDPSNEEAVAEVAAIARSLERWPYVIETVRGFVGAEEDPRRRIQLCEHAARWCKESKAELGSGAADPFVVEIDQIDPSHWAVRRRMASIYREQGIWDLRREELERALLRAESSDEVRDTRFALGELHETRLADLQRATLHYEAALACAPKSRDVLTALARVFAARELHDRLRDTLIALVAVVTNPAERHPLLLQLADVWEKHFVKPAQAARLLEEALELTPNDAPAFERLEGCYRAMRAWPEYVQTLERRLSHFATDAERAAALVRIGRAFESALHDSSKSARAYRRACSLDPRNVDALTELARLSERSDDWRGAAICRERLAALVTEPRERARMHVAIGALLERPDRDPDRARAQYECATEIDPRLSAAWEGLQRLAEQEGAYATAARFLEERIARTEGRRAKGRLSIELGLLWERAGSGAKAIEAYEAAQAESPESTTVAHDLLRLYCETKRSGKGALLCAPLLRAAIADGDAARAIDVLRISCTVPYATEELETVLALGTRAAARFLEIREVTVALIDLSHAHRARLDVATALQEVLDAVVVDTSALPAAALVKLGEILWTLQETDLGIDLFVEALALDEACVPALRNLVEHFVACGDWQRASSYRLWLARVTPDRSTRFTLLVDTANDLFDGACDLEQAAWAYEEARAMEPGYRVLLDRLVSIYTSLGDWRRLLDVQRTIADSEELPALRASRVRSMALVAWSKLSEAGTAITLFEEALELDPTRLDVLDAVGAICAQEKDLRGLARIHGRLIARVEGIDLPACEPAWSGSRTGSNSSLRPPRTEGSGIVPIESIERATGRIESSLRVKQLRRNVTESPLSYRAYRELGTELRALGGNDAAWCALAAFRHLGGSDDEIERFLQTLGAPELKAASGTLTEADWYTNVLEPELDRPLLAAVTLASAAMRAIQSLPSRGAPLSRGGAGKTGRLVGVVEDAARVLRLPAPTVYERTGGPDALRVSFGPEPVLEVSFGALDQLPAGSLPFVVGRALAELHPLLAVRATHRTPAELRALFEAARGIDDPTGSDDATHTALREALSEAELGELADMIAFVLSRPEMPDFQRLHRQLELSTLRAGLLLQGTVDRAWAVIAREGSHASELPRAETHEHLLTFSVSAGTETFGLAPG